MCRLAQVAAIMGIHNLAKLIADHASSAIKESDIKNYFGMQLLYYFKYFFAIKISNIVVLWPSKVYFLYADSMLCCCLRNQFPTLSSFRQKDCNWCIDEHLSVFDRGTPRWQPTHKRFWWDNQVKMFVFLQLHSYIFIIIR